MKKLINLLIIFILIFVFTSCSNQENTQTSLTNFYFDTSVTITIYDMDNSDSDLQASDIINECFSLCNHYEQIFSRTIETSDISKINNSNGKTTEVNQVVCQLIEDSIHYSQITNGAFDITIAPVSILWNIDGENANIPSDKQIKKAMKHVNYKNISINNDTVTLSDPDAKIDMGAIVKGFVADKLKNYMISEGVTSAIIDLGGNILTIGGKTSDEDFTIGIREPFSDSNNYAATIKINDKSVVTSGIYERYFKKGGKIYHHIFDTKTGYPVENNLYSVTIISDISEDGDALSTSVFALGLDKGLNLINSLENTEAIFITDKNKIILSEGLEMNSNNEISLKQN